MFDTARTSTSRPKVLQETPRKKLPSYMGNCEGRPVSMRFERLINSFRIGRHTRPVASAAD